MGVAWALHGRGMGVAREWGGRGMGVAWAWFERYAGGVVSACAASPASSDDFVACPVKFRQIMRVFTFRNDAFLH